MHTPRRAKNGLGIDASGGPVVDPTANVIALNDAANQRQDDLRELTNKYTESRLSAVEALAQLRAEHAREIRLLESDRLDKIRQVDVLAGNTAADRALVAIQTLATSQATAAETLRAMVQSTATTIATQTAGAMAAVTERLSALEKSSYEGKGKQALTDPQLVELMTEMKGLRESRSESGGKFKGAQAVWGYIIGAAGLLLAIASFALRAP